MFYECPCYSVLPHMHKMYAFICNFLSSFYLICCPQRKLVAGCYILKNNRIFLPRLVMKVSLCSDSRRSSAYSQREGLWRAEDYTHHVLFVVLVTSQMSPGKTASIPSWLFPSDFSNGAGNNRVSIENSFTEPGESAASLPR